MIQISKLTTSALSSALLQSPLARDMLRILQVFNTSQREREWGECRWQCCGNGTFATANQPTAPLTAELPWTSGKLNSAGLWLRPLLARLRQFLNLETAAIRARGLPHCQAELVAVEESVAVTCVQNNELPGPGHGTAVRGRKSENVEAGRGSIISVIFPLQQSLSS